ncbi:hypothetical protein C8D92_10831 [Tamilnaduibacter salinus]|uniref:Uncharacterized protein n=1 Tax=Tamilnaduibacter salinus TaxID=1484056 RepID=A0A2U1CUB5_9GAMM|nr:hypothetical protein [Tamilnaduibacter salinus]PVY70675.1 hypothetical protein C8D92_10831 [Tamilnaduibacter salinus]
MYASIIPTTFAGFVRRVLSPILALAVLSGCGVNPIYHTTGVVITGYAESEATPYVLQMSDAKMACSMGSALDPLVSSFGRVTDFPNETGSLMQLLSANCAEAKAWEADLAYLRADYQGNVAKAKDARTQAKRWHKVTAERRLETFRRAMKAYEYDVTADSPECPFLYNDQDELTFLLGLLTGMQAIVNDTNSGGTAGVPKNIAPQAERAAQCLDNEKWGGIPNAIRANVWLLLPDTQPTMAPEPFKLLKASSQLGIEKGFRASMALEAVAAQSAGRDEVLADVIKRYADSEKGFTVRAEYALVDQVAHSVIQYMSDRHWTQEYGHRTPSAYFGRMSKKSSSDAEAMDLDGLL